MKYAKILIFTICLACVAGGCKQDLSIFKGNYLFVKKIDEADKSEKVYKRGDPRFAKGYAVSVSDSCLIASPVKIGADGKTSAAKWGKVLKLNQTDDDVFQYKKSDGSLVLTFMFSDSGLNIDEYQKNRSGGFSKESRLECIKK